MQLEIYLISRKIENRAFKYIYCGYANGWFTDSTISDVIR